jgi:hypothetical protein
MSTRGLRLAALVLFCGLAGAGAAAAAGPDPGVVQGTGQGQFRGDVLYIANKVGQRTEVEALRRSTGQVLRHMFVRGNLGIPRVAFDGTTDGLAADGRTLVLSQARTAQFRRTSSFAVIAVPRLKLRTLVKLSGDFSFDALSRDGRLLYLIEHVSAQEAAKYRVRAYDLAAGRLLKKMVTDKRRWQSVMVGVPMSRATSKDRRWVFTLYGGGAHPFVHSLDTRKAYAVCIDLPQSWRQLDFTGVRLRMQGDGRLVIGYGAGTKPLAVIDTKKFRVLSAVRNP